MRTSAKAAQFTESVIRETFRLAAQHGAINLGQGFPDFPCPPELKAAACAAIAGRRQPVPDDVRHPRAAGRDRGEDGADVPGLGGRPRHRGVRHLRGHRGPGRGDVRAAGSRRRDRAVRALVRELPAERDPLGRGRAAGAAAGAGLVVRRGRAAGGVRAAHEGGVPLPPEQPDRQGLPGRRAGPARRAVRAVGRRAGGGLDLRAHPPARARRLPAARAGAGPGRPHGHGQRAVEDLRGDRVAGGLDARPRGDHRRDPQGARLPDDRRPGAPAGGGVAALGLPASYYDGLAARVPRAPRPAVRRAGGARVRPPPPGRLVLRAVPTSAASPPTATAWRSPVG